MDGGQHGSGQPAAGTEPETRLPGGVTVDALREAVTANRSWRGVLRHFGMSAPRNGRVLRAACDALGISYAHFQVSRWPSMPPETLATALDASSSWTQVIHRLGFAEDSGSARASVRRRALELGLDVSHLTGRPEADADDPFAGSGDVDNLRHAATFLVAAKCTLLGHRVAWPLEPQPYDLLVDTRQRGLLRVQVKSSTRFADGSWIASITRRARAAHGQRTPYTAEDIDYFGVVVPDGEVYMLPIALVEGQTGVSLRKYENFRIAC